jgi:hypothetical protein
LMSASRYGVMSLRFGKPAAKPPEPAAKPRPYRVGNSNWMGA